MDCREFGSLTKDFIFDDINDTKKIKEYIEHARICKECRDELEVIYSMHRSLGDVMGPDGKDTSADYMKELEEIDEYYMNLFKREKGRKALLFAACALIILIIVIAAFCLLREI